MMPVQIFINRMGKLEYEILEVMFQVPDLPSGLRALETWFITADSVVKPLETPPAENPPLVAWRRR